MAETMLPETEQILRRAGWFPGRRVDTEAFARAIEALGSRPLPMALELLEEFGGLWIEFPDPMVRYAIDNIVMDPTTDMAWPDETFSSRIEKPFCPIGMAHQHYMLLLMDEDGVVYAGYGDLLQRVASSGIGALNAIILNYPREEIP